MTTSDNEVPHAAEDVDTHATANDLDLEREEGTLSPLPTSNEDQHIKIKPNHSVSAPASTSTSPRHSLIPPEVRAKPKKARSLNTPIANEEQSPNGKPLLRMQHQGDGPLKVGDELIGEDLRIKLLASIGEGSFAQVFEAIELDTQLVMAAKIFIEGDDDVSSQEARLKLAEHEYNVVGFLTHDNVVRVHGLLLTGQTVCILQELCRKGDLFNAVTPGFGLHPEQVVAVLQGLSSALRYLHDDAVAMAHLDIKPENVLLTDSGIPKLCDFDTAMKLGSEPSTMRGTPEYQSPECLPGNPEYWQLRESTDSGGFPVHSALDVWALGLVAYFIMFGDYCWGRAEVLADKEYEAFAEGEHMVKSPWKFMPLNILTFFNRTLDARQHERACANELTDMVDNTEEMMTSIRTTRTLLIADKDPSADTPTIKELNQSDRWRVTVVTKKRKSVAFYEISLTPPRETDKLQRVCALLRYRRLLQLHQIVCVTHPPPQATNPCNIRPISFFPKKKRIGNKTSKFVETRRMQLQEYFEISLQTQELATFWYDTIRQQQDETLDDNEHGDD